MYRVIIPARYGSTRLPGKPLLVLAGKPMVQWVHERALRAGADEVIIATDDVRIVQAARAFGATALMTDPSHASGTDRIAEVARRARWPQSDVIVNVQGDEPLMPEALIGQVASLLTEHPGAAIATLATPVDSAASLLDPNVVKVVTDAHGRALYFSRAPIPWNRDGAPGGLAGRSSHSAARRHVGLYAYRVAALLRLAALAPSELERIEQLEQLRALENGLQVQVADARVLPGADVNTAADVAMVEALLAGQH